MNDRQALILSTIIKEYIKTGVPVSSHALVDVYNLDISSATVRNVMADLEDQGLIIQPHTSAGRIPTEEAYKWYITKLNEQKLGSKETRVLSDKLNNQTAVDFRQAAKALAEFSGLAVFWATDRDNVYYTGVANLLSQPEFLTPELIYGLSEMIDSLDEIIENYFDKINNQPLILIGSEGPFGDYCSSILIKYRHDGQEGAVGILGPTRLDYQRNLALIKYVNELLCRRN